MTENAKAMVDAKIDEMGTSENRFLLLDQDLWGAFITETGMAPEKVPSSDERILYRDVELRESAAG